VFRNVGTKYSDPVELAKIKNSTCTVLYTLMTNLHLFVVILFIIIIIIIIITRYACLLSQAFLPGTSLEPAVIPTAQASSFTLQYFPYYV